MKTFLFKSGSLFVLFVLFFSTNSNANFERNIHKNWPIEKVKALSVNNKFGDINFVSSRDDSVIIDVDIYIEDRKAEYLADQLEFKFSYSDGTIYAKTEFGDKFKTNRDFSIVYTINIPTDRNLKIQNKYGDVKLGNLLAQGDFEIKYGNIQGLKLNAPADKKINLELKYGNATFQEISNLVADIGYSKVSLGDMSYANLDTKYSIIKTGEVAKLIVDSKYDTYKVNLAGSMDTDSKYSNWDIKKLQSTLVMDNQYGDIYIDEVSESFQSIDIESDYATIVIGMPELASYKLKSECLYCNIQHSGGKIIKDIDDDNKKYLRVNVGEEETDSYVDIESRYGDIKLTK